MGSILNAMFLIPTGKKRVYGYETPQGTIVVSVEEGFKIEKNRLLGLEEKIKEYLSQSVSGARWPLAPSGLRDA
jgi:hypothetical protein